VCFVVFCLLVVDRKIIAFKAYLPVLGVIWGEIMSRGDFFFFAMINTKCAEEPVGLIDGSSPRSEECEFDERDYLRGCGRCDSASWRLGNEVAYLRKGPKVKLSLQKFRGNLLCL